MLSKTELLAHNGLFRTEGILFETLKNEHIDEVIPLFIKAFCDHEPMTHHLKIQYTEFRPFAEKVIKKAALNGLSIVARIGTRIVACAIVEDIANPICLDLDELDPKFKFIFTLLEQLSGQFLEQKKFIKTNLSHLFITAVDVNHQGSGLSKKVNFAAMKLSEEHGFDFMCCEFTNERNEKGSLPHIKHKKVLIGSCCYKDFIIDGIVPFQNLNGSANAYLWELRPEARLRYYPLSQTADNLISHNLEEIYEDETHSMLMRCNL